MKTILLTCFIFISFHAFSSERYINNGLLEAKIVGTDNLNSFPPPIADAGLDQIICISQAVVIGGSPTSTTPGVTFVWDNGISLTDPTLANPTATPNITTTYTVTVTEIVTGLTSTDQVTITVNPMPNVDAGLDQSICSGQSIFIGGSPTGPSGSTFMWDNPASLNDPTFSNPTSSPLSTTTYTVTITNGNGCTATDQVTINVAPSPIVDFAYAANCNLPVQFNDLSTIAAGALTSWSWDFGDGVGISTQQNPSYQYSTSGSYSVKLTTQSTLGCVDSITKNVIITTLPNVNAGADQSVCIGQSVTLGGSPTTTTPNATFLWSPTIGLNSSTVANPIASPTVTTTYTVTTTSASGCDSTDQVVITVNGVNVGVSQAGISLTASVAGATYQWIDCATNLAIPREISQTFVATVNGNYAVDISSNGCRDTSVCLQVISVGLDEVKVDETVRLFPNPNKGSFNLEFVESANRKITVFDKNGRIVMEELEENRLQFFYELDLEGGTYFIKIQTKEQVKILPMLVQ